MKSTHPYCFNCTEDGCSRSLRERHFPQAIAMASNYPWGNWVQGWWERSPSRSRTYSNPDRHLLPVHHVRPSRAQIHHLRCPRVSLRWGTGTGTALSPTRCSVSSVVLASASEAWSRTWSLFGGHISEWVLTRVGWNFLSDTWLFLDVTRSLITLTFYLNNEYICIYQKYREK